MGWEEIKVAAEYDGDHHRTNPTAFNKDIIRHENVTEAGWINVRVTARDTQGSIIQRVAAARARRS